MYLWRMSQYIVSARKYRPQIFSEVVGQEQVTATLKNALKSNHLAQSFLFCGPRGVGKTTCARILAKAINCQQPSDDMEPCNTCSSCKSFNEQSSFNIHELDAASNNSVDDMRALIEQVRFAPQAGKYKVYIIDEVHMLSQAAFNAFLKTLEEPPSYAIFILATTEKHKIIPTILSRCQIFDFKRIGVKDISDHLDHIAQQEGLKAEGKALHTIAQKADGALRDALSIFDKIASFSGESMTYQQVIDNLNILDYEYFFRITDQLMAGDNTSVLLSYNDVLSRGFEGDTFMLGLAEHFRNLLMCKDIATLPLLEVSDDVALRFQQQGQAVSSSFLLNALDIAAQLDSSYKMARNKRLAVELSLLKICFLNRQIEVAMGQVSEPSKKKQGTPVAEDEPASVPVKPESTSTSQSVTTKETEPVATQPEPVSESVDASAATGEPEETSTTQEPSGDSATPNIEEQAEHLAESLKADPIEEAPQTSDTGLNSGGGLMGELQQALKGKPVHSEEEEKEQLPLNPENLKTCWEQFMTDNADELQANFISNAKDLLPHIEEGNKIVLNCYSSVSRGFITEQSSNIKAYLREFFGIKELSFIVELVEEEEDDNKPKNYLNPKEQFKELAKENPALLDFQKRFDLDIDY